jgi:RNase P/RNase MRP subunit p29
MAELETTVDVSEVGVVGAVVSTTGLFIVIETEVDVVWFPAASLAVAVKT